MQVESERTVQLLAALADIAEPQVRARVAQVRTLLTGEADRVVSFDDPDARSGYKAADEPFCGYKAHEALDPDSRLITAVDVVPGNAHEALRANLLAQDTQPCAERAVVIGDTYYHNTTTVAQVEAAGARPCFSGRAVECVSDAFPYDAAADQLVCLEGKWSIGKVRVDNGDYFSMRDCPACPRRRVYLSDLRKHKVLAGEAGKRWRQAHLKLRSRIEPKFSEQVNQHGLRYARYWGLAKVTLQVLLNVITVNLKRAVKLLTRGAGQRPVEVTT